MENLDKLEKAGRIAGEALQFGKGLIKENTSLLEITKKVEDKITELGGKCAFPVQLSLNEVAAHYNALIEDKIIIKANDVVKLDVGVHVDGFIGDNALTVSLNEDYNDLVKASEKALEEALKIVRIGTKLREIGGVIESEITNLGYKPVKNLTGHSIEEYREHAGLAVPNFDNGDNWELK